MFVCSRGIRLARLLLPASASESQEEKLSASVKRQRQYYREKKWTSSVVVVVVDRSTCQLAAPSQAALMRAGQTAGQPASSKQVQVRHANEAAGWLGCQIQLIIISFYFFCGLLRSLRSFGGAQMDLDQKRRVLLRERRKRRERERNHS